MSTAVPPTFHARARLARARFRDWILNPNFACVGAKSAIQREQYRLEMYGEMGSDEASDRLATDLAAFVRDQDVHDSTFSTFAASFTSPRVPDEETFEILLWKQLQQLHGRDSAPWDVGVSDDPADQAFAFSYAGRAFFVVGLHPASSRVSRQFDWPTLVFNARFQFERLRVRGRYARMQTIIRARERAVQGSENPMLSDFGTRSEARQYSGRRVDDGWECPFHPARSRAGDESVRQRNCAEEEPSAQHTSDGSASAISSGVVGQSRTCWTKYRLHRSCCDT